jgi:hypothetical protein
LIPGQEMRALLCPILSAMRCHHCPKSIRTTQSWIETSKTMEQNKPFFLKK